MGQDPVNPNPHPNPNPGPTPSPNPNPNPVQQLRNATFCAVFPGNGWGHLEAPIIMGCIPVVVQDEILVPWENVLDFGSFGLRIPRAQLPRLPQILRAIPEERVRQLQRGLVSSL